ncbi:PucR family transcriptional regulator [Catenulispora pinisilvae]|uniref:PucR family transcriptional regulator n=1 Tax=Catenulispora pinisilvae TaxID=2705253 RepID=UPI00189123D1|nr:helix-turn-helix domain-containing protein [Catenulispora pinisilvae]
MAAVHTPEVEAEARALVARFAERLDELADLMAAHILAESAVLRSLVAEPELRVTCAQNINQLLTVLGGRPPAGSAPVDTGRAGVRDGVPMSALFDAYQIGATFLWEELAEAGARDGWSAAAVILLATKSWRHLHEFTTAMSESYRAELETRVRKQVRRRSALVQALLEGNLADPELWEAADLLRLPHQGPYVVIAARVAAIAESALPSIEQTLDALGIGSAWQLTHDLEVGVASLPRPGDQFDRLIEKLDADGASRVGVSPLYEDLAATSQAVRLAQIALRGAADQGRVVVFGRDPLSVAAASAPDVMRRLARAILGGLDSMPAEDRVLLLDTFGAWLDSSGSTEETARRLHVHPNTVRYRLRRLEERTGRLLSDPRQVAELSLAFEVVRGREPRSAVAETYSG